jgi:hypothetical protein
MDFLLDAKLRANHTDNIAFHLSMSLSVTEQV